jgi:hypothetical protein
MTVLRAPALVDASRRGGAVIGDACAKAASGEPDDIRVDRDLDHGVAGAVVWLARADGEYVGQCPLPEAGGKLVQPLPLAGDPGAGAEGVVDGASGVADGYVHVPPVVVAHTGEVAALGAADLGKLADVELAVVAAGGSHRDPCLE